VSSQELLTFLHAKLPSYMVPTGIVSLERLPLNRHGKLDRNKLPAYERKDTAVEEAVTAPRNEIEQRLVDLWRSVLQVETIGIYDNFFELGGHSLMATQLVSQIRLAFGFHLPLHTLFDVPTIAGIAAIVASEQEANQEVEDLMKELEDLSDGELQQLLSEARGGN
jgi:acyl carrier protein